MTDQIEAVAAVGDEVDELIAVTRRFAATMSGAPRCAGAEDWWDGLCEIGLERCLLPDELGGIGLPPATLPALIEELAAGDGGAALAALLSNVALWGLAGAGATGTQGDAHCVLVPAPEVSVDASGLVHGAVPTAYDATRGSRLVVCAGIAGEGGLWTLEPGSPRLRAEPVRDQLGLDGAPAAALALDGVAAQRLGDGTEATTLLHAGVAAIARGIARRAERMALAYAERRYQGGGLIIGHGAVRDMLARMAERRLACAGAGPGLAAAIAARIAATDAAVATTTDAVQVFGGMGYMVETGVERLMRDAKACQLYPTPNWLLRDRLLELGR